MAAFRPQFHTSLASKLVDDVFYQRNHLFLWIGKVDQWKEYIDDKVVVDQCDCDCPTCVNNNGTLITVEYGDSKNPHRDPDGAYANETTMRDNIAYIHKISADDISVVAPNHLWKSGTFYTQWDNTKDLTKLSSDNPFYVVNSDYQVFKCLFNNKKINVDGTYELTPSTVEPRGVSYDPIETLDGYLWKYMYTVPLTKRTKFYNSRWIPVQKAVENTFYNRGAIEQILVTSGGSGYSNDPKTTAVVDGPGTTNGEQAEVSLFVNPETGSIDDVYITNPGKNYVLDPAIRIVDLQGTGTGKYDGNTSAILQGHIKNGQLENVSIIDCGVNYPADTATSIVVQGDGSGCVAYPVIVDGSIQGVRITNPGVGYTYADIIATCSKDPLNVVPATFKTKLGGEIQIDEQSVVEQLALPGAIYAIEVTNGGADYSANTQILIDGDGEGCQAHAIVDQGRILQVVIDNPGKGYTRAVVTFFDENRKEPNPNPKAEGYAILPPTKGHGYNAVEELYGNTVANYATVRSDNLLANMQQEFRQFGIIENLRTLVDKTIVNQTEVVITFDIIVDPPSTVSGNLKNDSIVYINKTPYRVLSMEGVRFMLQQMSSIYRDVTEQDSIVYTDPVSQKKYVYNIQSIESKPQVDKYSGTMLYSSNNTPFYMTDNKTLAIRTYIKL